MKKIIAIVVTFNRCELLKTVINGLLSQSYALHKILIIDNNSSDNTAELFINEFNDQPNVEYYNTGGNLGGAGGFQYGVSMAQNYDFDALWLMDDDLLPDNDCLELLVAEDIVGLIQPIRFNRDGSCAELSPVKYDLRNPLVLSPKQSSVKDIYDETSREPISLEGISFEGPLISKEVVDEIGLPDARFFIFYDDLEYAIRARQKNYKVICSTAAKARRLLVNNQKNDLSSWKGYFMLRNIFYIHHVYGENIFVKLKPYAIWFGISTISLFKRDFSLLLKCYNAIRDFKELKNNDRNKPS